MPFEIHLTAEQVTNNEHKNYDPNCYDFLWNETYTECDVYSLSYTDDHSYAEWQGDPASNTEGDEEPFISDIYKDQAGHCPGGFADKDPGYQTPFEQLIYAGIATLPNDDSLPF